ncbi:hypothetical protein DINM_002907, partial [Dirofilaria immitis]|nr:hypothetical protein [Dirofilaria immitis]
MTWIKQEAKTILSLKLMMYRKGTKDINNCWIVSRTTVNFRYCRRSSNFFATGTIASIVELSKPFAELLSVLDEQLAELEEKELDDVNEQIEQLTEEIALNLTLKWKILL